MIIWVNVVLNRTVQWLIQRRGPPPTLIFRPKFFGRMGYPPPPLSLALDDQPPPPLPLSQGLDLALLLLTVTDIWTTCVIVIFKVKVSGIMSVDDIDLALVVQKLNSAIHQINHYPVDKY